MAEITLFQVHKHKECSFYLPPGTPGQLALWLHVPQGVCPCRCVLSCVNITMSYRFTRLRLNWMHRAWTSQWGLLLSWAGLRLNRYTGLACQGRPQNIRSLNYDKVFLRHTIPALLFLGPYIFKVFTPAWVALSNVAWTWHRFALIPFCLKKEHWVYSAV